jgi:hypothetical protein
LLKVIPQETGRDRQALRAQADARRGITCVDRSTNKDLLVDGRLPGG